MDLEIQSAQRKVRLLNAQRMQIESEIRQLQQQKTRLRRNIQENLAVLRRLQEILNATLLDVRSE